MERAREVIVVGGGVMGLATAYHLARGGHEVLLLEARGIGHSEGSSHGPSRIIRLTYQSEDYIELARAAFALWEALGDEAGEQLPVPCGGLDFGSPDANHMSELGEAMSLAGVAHESIDAAEIRRRFPQLNPPDDAIGFYQPDYAMLPADSCLRLLAAGARAAGGELHEHEAVLAVSPSGDGVEVRTARATYRSSRVVLALGSWLGPVAATLGLDLPLTVLKEQLSHFEPVDPALFAPGRFPLFIQRFPGSRTFGAGFPIFGEPIGVKLLIDRLGPVVTPDDPDRSIEGDILERLERYVAETVRGLTGRVVLTTSCRYTLTPDEDFIVDTHPTHPQIVIASPCSGHGFKFAIEIGRILAALALGQPHGRDISRFRLDRPSLSGRWTVSGEAPDNGRAYTINGVRTDPGQTGRAMFDAESKEWVEQLRSGHLRHEQAVARLHGVLLRVAFHELSRRRVQLGSIAGPELDDLAQQAADDALMNVLRKLDEFRGLSRFTTWAYKFVMFEVSSKVARHAWRRQPPSSEELDWDRLPDWLSPQPGERLEQREQLEALSATIGELTDRQREVFVAIALNDVPIDVLALQLGSNRNAVYKNLFDARRTLRSRLAVAGYAVTEEDAIR